MGRIGFFALICVTFTLLGMVAVDCCDFTDPVEYVSSYADPTPDIAGMALTPSPVEFYADPTPDIAGKALTPSPAFRLNSGSYLRAMQIPPIADVVARSGSTPPLVGSSG